MYKSFVSLGRYIPKYFILFVAMVNRHRTQPQSLLFQIAMFCSTCFLLNYNYPHTLTLTHYTHTDTQTDGQTLVTSNTDQPVTSDF